MATTKSSFKVTSWEEDRSTTDIPRVRPASITYELPEIGGKISAQYLMTYVEGGNASFVFTETVSASNFFGKEGTFITQGKGTFDATTYAVEATFSIVPGAGTGNLAHVAGKGSLRTKPSNEYSFQVQCSHDEPKASSSAN